MSLYGKRGSWPIVATSNDFSGKLEVSRKKRRVVELEIIDVLRKNWSVFQSCKGLLESSKETHLWSTTREGKTSEKIKDVGVVLVSIPYLFNQNLHSNSNCTTQPTALCSLRSLCSQFLALISFWPQKENCRNVVIFPSIFFSLFYAFFIPSILLK